MCELANQDVSFQIFEKKIEKNLQRSFHNYHKALKMKDKQAPHLKITANNTCVEQGQGQFEISLVTCGESYDGKRSSEESGNKYGNIV